MASIPDFEENGYNPPSDLEVQFFELIVKGRRMLWPSNHPIHVGGHGARINDDRVRSCGRVGGGTFAGGVVLPLCVAAADCYFGSMLLNGWGWRAFISSDE